MDLSIVILALFALGVAVFGVWARGRVKRAEHIIREGKVRVVLEKAKDEVLLADIDDLLKRGNKLYPGSGSKSGEDK